MREHISLSVFALHICTWVDGWTEDELIRVDWEGGANRVNQWIAWVVNGVTVGERHLQHTFVRNL